MKFFHCCTFFAIMSLLHCEGKPNGPISSKKRGAENEVNMDFVLVCYDENKQPRLEGHLCGMEITVQNGTDVCKLGTCKNGECANLKPVKCPPVDPNFDPNMSSL
ncbi:uncharacterized protein LOC144118628 [Amblyomma americanum]